MAFRILSLDGGGMRGIITARILQDVEARLGQPLNQCFDLIAGTSTGSLLAAGIAIGMSADELLAIYLNDGEMIFPQQQKFSPKALLRIFSGSKFSNRGLIAVAQKHLGYQTLASVAPDPDNPMKGLKLLMTSYDTNSRDAIIFKSWKTDKWYNRKTVLDEKTGKRERLSLWQACVSSASAPTFLPAMKIDAELDNGTPHEYSLLDGGVCANNPSACAVAEAIRLLGEYCNESPVEAIRDIKILSIGTGDLTQPLPWKQVSRWGLIQWGLKIADVFMDAPSDVHDYVTKQIIAEALSNDGLNESDQKYLRLQINRKTLASLKKELSTIPNDEELEIPMDNASKGNLELMQSIAQAYITSANVFDGAGLTIRDRLDTLLENWLIQ